jgi:hypothetical protein
MRIWKLLAEQYPGWTLNEVKELTKRERANWINLIEIKN